MNLEELGMWQVIDLSPPLGEQTHCYPTDPQFSLTWHMRIPPDAANVSRIDTGPHAGAHVDAPLHFLQDGTSVGRMPLSSFLGPAVAISALKTPGEDITAADLANADVRRGDIVLFHTGWGRRMNTEAFFEEGWPGYSEDLLEQLIARGVRAIGADTPSADNASGAQREFASHKIALRANLVIFEGLVNLDEVAGQRFFFIGLPLRLEQAEASPVRAVAIVP